MVPSRPILITGAQGFIGAPLLRRLKQKGLPAQAAELDLLRPESVVEAIRTAKPALVVHLAGLSHVPTCEKDPELAFRTNRDGTRRVAEALSAHGAVPARLIFASSAQVYAAAEGDELTSEAVFTEDRKILPQNTYARTKWEAEEQLREVGSRTGLETTVLRLFSHTHKTQSPEFFLPHVYAELRAGKTVIPVGNLEIFRDFGALEDLISAFESVITQPGRGQIFNICSGRVKHLGRMANGLAKRLGIPARFETDPGRVRRGEAISLCGSHQRITSATGWTPKRVTEEALLDSFLADLTFY